MSGHSKWSTIKRDKAINDARRSRLFSKVSRLITVAAREGGGDPDSNPALRLAIEKAKYARMPKENIEKAIKKGTGELGGGIIFEEVIYEGFGPAGVAFYIKALTDNKNRTVSEVRSIFGKNSGSLGGAGSTSYIFANDSDEPSFLVEVDEKQKSAVLKLCEELEDQDDVQDFFFNVEI